MSPRQKLAFFVLLVLYVLPFWLYPLFPSQDGPSHLYNTVIFTDLLWNPNCFFSNFYELNWGPFPNWIFTGLASIFYPLFPILIAEKVILSLYLAGFVSAMFYFIRSIQPEKTWLAFGAFLFSYNWFLWMGFYNFCLSVPLAFFIIGYSLRHRSAMFPARLVWLMLLFVLLYFSHVISFAIVLLVLGFLHVDSGPKRWRSLGELGLCALPALCLFAIHFAGQSRVDATMYRTPISWLAANTISFKIGPWFHRLEWIWLGLFWLTLGTWLVQTWMRPRPEPAGKRIWWIIVGLVLALSLVVPYNFLGGSAFNDRLAFYGGLLLLGTLSMQAWSQQPARWLMAAFAILVITQLIYIHFVFRQWNYRLEPFRKAADHVEPGVRLLPLMFAKNVVGFYANPLLHADSYILMEQRCASPANYEAHYSFFPVRYRDGAPLAVAPDWFVPQSYLQHNLLQYYEYVLLWNAPVKEVSGFDPLFMTDDIQLLKRQ